MAEINTALGSATGLFGVAIVLAVLVTGFFKGRSWLADREGSSGGYRDDTYENGKF